MKHKVKSIHFVGIGGSGMSGIAEILINLDYEISGSDLVDTPITQRLESLGAEIFYDHDASNVAERDLVVISSAISHENLEVSEAEKLKIPVIGVVDTNNSPEGIDYVIPGNDDSMRAIEIYVERVADAILEAKASSQQAQKEEFVEVEEAASKASDDAATASDESAAE